MRAATDAAAKAAAEEILSGNQDSVTSAGQNDASINGFTRRPERRDRYDQ